MCPRIYPQEGNSKPPRSKSAIPPLARGRGMSFRIRTPAEDRRYVSVYPVTPALRLNETFECQQNAKSLTLKKKYCQKFFFSKIFPLAIFFLNDNVWQFFF